jgi:hypothetical protein
MTLSVENLYALSDAAVPGQVYGVFVNQLQAAPSVHGTFFASTGTPPIGPVNPGWVDGVAIALVCSSIARSSLYGFARTVNGGTADARWRSWLDGTTGLASGQALYDWAFPAYCTADGQSFQQYLASDPASWGAQLADEVTSGPFINTMINKLIPADPNWLRKLNLVFYKLHRLDPAQEQRAVAVWHDAYPPAIEQWQSYNYLASAYFSPTQFLGQVNAAISVGKDEQWCTVVNGLPYCNYWTEYGDAVVSFVNGPASQAGLATGQKPDNEVPYSPAGCFLPGTPVHLHDGTTVAVEDVAAGHRVLARDGVVATHTDERVEIDVAVPLPVYGFNELEPFFSAGHLFATPEGWKAIDPEIARAENPTRAVGKLEVGDIVYRVRDGEPFGYDEVRIERLTGTLLEDGARLHGMHLDGAHSYHAHGFLVAMNYPMITERRLTDGFATLSPEERAALAETFEHAMPLIRKALGRFVERPLRRALSG